MSTVLLAIGGYLPRNRISRQTIADVWGGAALPGERALAGPDEDAVTMAVEAARACLGDRDPADVGALFFASTTAPYAERHAASIVAAALRLRSDAATVDVSDTLRAGTTALRLARDAVGSGSARVALVVAADRRAAEPESPAEQLFGDGGAAVLVSDGSTGSGLATLDGLASVTDDVSTGWRRPEDRFVRSYSPKHEVEFGFVEPLTNALTAAAASAGVEPTGCRLAVPSPDGRAHFRLAKRLGIHPDRIADPLVVAVGALGTPAPLLSMVVALETAAVGETILVGAAGEGADGLVVTVRSPLPADGWRPSAAVADGRKVRSYGDLVRANQLMDMPEPLVESSPVRYWRDRAQYLPLHGMRCLACDLVQYPIARVCRRCHAVDRREEVPLTRKGKVFTYTFDHLVAATYSTIPVIRAIVDLEGGGRILTQVVDCEPASVSIGTPVELVFRRTSDGGGFKNYFWKARPPARQEVAA